MEAAVSSADAVPEEFLAQVAFMLQLCVPDGDDDEDEVAAAVAERLGAWLSHLAPDGLAECDEPACELPANVMTPNGRCPFHDEVGPAV